MPLENTTDDAINQATSALLSQIAQLCAVANVHPDKAIQVFQAAYSDASQVTTKNQKNSLAAFLAASILTEWHQNDFFCQPDGTPKALSVKNGEFSELCRSVSIDADSTIMLDLLQISGAVKVSEGSATAIRRELILGDFHPAAVARAIQLSAEFISTLYRNLGASKTNPKLFERTVVNTKIMPEHVPALLAFLGTHGQSFLEDVDSWMSVRESPIEHGAVGVGMYLFVRE
jgi:hypothetical protein